MTAIKEIRNDSNDLLGTVTKSEKGFYAGFTALGKVEIMGGSAWDMPGEWRGDVLMADGDSLTVFGATLTEVLESLGPRIAYNVTMLVEARTVRIKVENKERKAYFAEVFGKNE